MVFMEQETEASYKLKRNGGRKVKQQYLWKIGKIYMTFNGRQQKKKHQFRATIYSMTRRTESKPL